MRVLGQDAVDEPSQRFVGIFDDVTRRQAPQRFLVQRIQRQGFLLEDLGCQGRIEIGPGQVGREQPCLDKLRIDLQGPASQLLGFMGIVIFQGQLGHRRENLRRVGILGQRRLELPIGVGLVVLLQVQPARLVMGRPVVRIDPQGVRAEIARHDAELIVQTLPACILGRGQPDPAQRLGVLHIVPVVELDQLVIGPGRLLQPAGNAEQFPAEPFGLQLVAAQLQGRLDVLLGGRVVAAIEGQPGQLCLDLGVSGRRLGKRFRRLLAHPSGVLRSGQSQRGPKVLLRQRAVGILGLGVLAAQQQLAGVGQVVSGRVGDRKREECPYKTNALCELHKTPPASFIERPLRVS